MATGGALVIWGAQGSLEALEEAWGTVRSGPVCNDPGGGFSVANSVLSCVLSGTVVINFDCFACILVLNCFFVITADVTDLEIDELEGVVSVAEVGADLPLAAEFALILLLNGPGEPVIEKEGGAVL